MNEQQLFNLLVGAVVTLTTLAGSGVAWWVSTIWGMVKTLQTQVSSLHVELAKNYAPRAELQSSFDRIFDKLDQIQKELHEARMGK
jgi:hypothetical protein